METNFVDIRTKDDLLRRERYEPSLQFYPRAARKFGEVLGPYVFLEPIECGIASCGTPHLRGYLITTDDEKETSIGNLCGMRHFGVEFKRKRRAVDQAVDRARRIETITNFKASLPELISLIEGIDRDYATLRDLKRRLIGAIGEGVFGTLKGLADRGTSSITRHVPMTPKEAEAFFATSNRHPGDGKGWPTNEVVIASFEGLAFISARFKDMVDVGLLTPLREMQAMPTDAIATIKPRLLNATAKWVGEVPGRIAVAQDIINAGWQFFTPENIGRLVHIGADRSALTPMISDLPAHAAIKGRSENPKPLSA